MDHTVADLPVPPPARAPGCGWMRAAGLAAASLGLWSLAAARWGGLGAPWTARPVSALALILLGACAVARTSDRRLAAVLGPAAGAVILVAALSSLLERLAGIHLGRVERLLGTFLEPRAGSGAEMSPMTAAGFALIAAALLVPRRGRRVDRARALAVGGGAALAALSLLASAFDGETTGEPLAGALMSVPSAVGGLALATAWLRAHPELAAARLLMGEGLAGTLVRRLLPTATLGALVAAWVRLQGERLRLFGAGFGLALHTVVGIAIIWTAILLSAAWLERVDARRREAETRLSSVFGNVVAGIARLDRDGAILLANDAFAGMVGFGSGAALADARPRISDLVVEPDAQRALAASADPAAPGNVELAVAGTDGRPRALLASVAPVVGAEGVLAGFDLVVVDVTHEREAERRLRENLGALRRSYEVRRKLLAELLRAQEDERARIAGEIHDDAVQVLAAIQLRLETMQADGSSDPKLEILTERVRGSIARLRRLMTGLMPPGLEHAGLVPALRLERESGLTVEVVDELAEEPPQEERLILYRIAQEALTNVRKHAGVDRATIVVGSDDRCYSLVVRDEGRGFDPTRADGEALHFGLRMMRERAEIVGGKLTIESRVGLGTEVRATLPRV